jgi:Domain of unknown function (DUF5666)
MPLGHVRFGCLSSFLRALAGIGAVGLFLQLAGAQDPPATPAIEGYVTATHSPDSFDVNGKPVEPWANTSYRRVDDKCNDTPVSGIYDVRVGMYVKVSGDSSGGTLHARSITIYGDAAKEEKGFGLIVRVLTPGPEPVFAADGYRIYVTPATTTSFSGNLKSLSDVGPNTWLKYVAVRDKAGKLVAIQATFVPGGSSANPPTEPEWNHPISATIPKHAKLIDADGNPVSSRGKFRMSDTGGGCGWHQLSLDPALQVRVSQVGMSVVPAYQKQLPPNSLSKINFRFIAVEDVDVRSEITCNHGLILVPREVAERLKTDAELAAVLADGVASFLQWQSSAIVLKYRELLGSEIVAAYLAGFSGTIAMHEAVERPIEIKLREQRDRMDLELIADAGYDSWAAPEAWRLLDPKKLPSDLTTLKYPSRSTYQLAILHEEYKKDAQPDVSTASATAGQP